MEYCDDDREYIRVRKTDSFVAEQRESTPTDTMDHSSRYYADKIAEYTAWAETTAQTLYKNAIAGTITYAEAWYGLPGPAPVVHTHQQGTGYTPNGAVMSRGGTVYVGQYRFLPANDIATLKLRFDEEFGQYVEARAASHAMVNAVDKKTETDLKARLETARVLSDQLLAGLSRREGQLTQLRQQLADLEAAVVRERAEALHAKTKKDAAETAFQTFMSERDGKNQSARIEIEAKDRRLGELRESGTARQAKEGGDLDALYQKKESATNAESEEAKRIAEDAGRARLAAAQQREFEKRIEEEVQRRTKDAEFERLVRERMNQLHGRA